MLRFLLWRLLGLLAIARGPRADRVVPRRRAGRGCCAATRRDGCRSPRIRARGCARARGRASGLDARARPRSPARADRARVPRAGVSRSRSRVRCARRRRRYVRLRVEAYRGDHADVEARRGDVRGAAQAAAAALVAAAARSGSRRCRWRCTTRAARPRSVVARRHLRRGPRADRRGGACRPPIPTAGCARSIARSGAPPAVAAPEEARRVHQARARRSSASSAPRAADRPAADASWRRAASPHSCSSR